MTNDRDRRANQILVTPEITSEMIEAGALVLTEWLEAPPYSARIVAVEVYKSMMRAQEADRRRGGFNADAS